MGRAGGVAIASLGLAFASVVLQPPAPARAKPALTADLDATARAEGNRRSEAVKIGRVLFATIWPVQIVRVRVEGVGSHAVAGLHLSAVKFHGALDRSGFLNEIETLVGRTFATSRVEEVDVWATVPIPHVAGVPVSGDLAKPTSRTVFAVTCRREQLGGLSARLRSARDVYWASDFEAGLRGR